MMMHDAAQHQLELFAPLRGDTGNEVQQEKGGNAHDHQQGVAQPLIA